MGDMHWVLCRYRAFASCLIALFKPTCSPIRVTKHINNLLGSSKWSAMRPLLSPWLHWRSFPWWWLMSASTLLTHSLSCNSSLTFIRPTGLFPSLRMKESEPRTLNLLLRVHRSEEEEDSEIFWLYDVKNCNFVESIHPHSSDGNSIICPITIQISSICMFYPPHSTFCISYKHVPSKFLYSDNFTNFVIRWITLLLFRE